MGERLEALRLCSEIPFVRAAKLFEALTHVSFAKNSSNLVCAGHVQALKLCSLCAQLYLASTILTRLRPLALPDLANFLDCSPVNRNQ